MLSRHNYSEQERKASLNPNRFALRKLNTGVCSLLVGLSFLGITAHADQQETNQQSAPVTTSQMTSADQSSQQLQTQQVTLRSQDQSTGTNSIASQNATATSNQFGGAVLTNLAVQSHEATDPVNVADWTYENHTNSQGVRDGITITGFDGNITDGKIIVPNSYDFEQAGIISDGQKVYADSYLRNNFGSTTNIHYLYGSNATEFVISHNGGGKVIATGDWNDAFMSVPYTIIDVTNLDVSQITSGFQYMFFNDTNLKQIIGLNTWNTSNAGSIGGMFEGDSNLTSVGNLSNWDTSRITNMREAFAFCSKLTSVGNLSNWKTNLVNNSEMMFANSGLESINISNWDLSNDTDVSNMFAYLVNPAVINMTGVKLPTSTNFTLNCFAGSRPIVVYSDSSAIQALNNDSIYTDANGNALKGRSNSDYLTINNKVDGSQLFTIPVNFVYANRNSLLATAMGSTTKDPLNLILQAEVNPNWSIADRDFTTGGWLIHDYTTEIPTVTGVYAVDLQGQPYTQTIEYVDDDGNVVGQSFTIDGHLNTVDPQTAIISKGDLNAQISQHIPSGYYLISQDPVTADVTINSTTPDPIQVRVSNKASVDVIFKDPNNNIVKEYTNHGRIGQTMHLDLTMPNGYEPDGVLPNANYTYISNDGQVVVHVKARTSIPTTPDHGQGGQSTTPTVPEQSPADGQSGNGQVSGPQIAGQVSVTQPTTTNQYSQQLPQTGDHNGFALAALGSLSMLLGLGLADKSHHYHA